MQHHDTLIPSIDFSEIPSVQRKILEDEDDTHVLVDVRTMHEREQGTLAGSIHCPVDQIHLLPGLISDTSTTIVTFCAHGIRSQHAGQYLRQHGYTRLYSLTGGLAALPADAQEQGIALARPHRLPTQD